MEQTIQKIKRPERVSYSRIISFISKLIHQVDIDYQFERELLLEMISQLEIDNLLIIEAHLKLKTQKSLQPEFQKLSHLSRLKKPCPHCKQNH